MRQGGVPPGIRPHGVYGEMTSFTMEFPAEISGHLRKTIPYYFFLVRAVPLLAPLSPRAA